MALFDTLKTVLTPYANRINDLGSRVPVLEDDINKIASGNIAYLASNKGGYVKTDGTVAVSNSARYSDFIEIPDDAYSVQTYVKATGNNGSTIYIKPAIVFYDETKKVITSASNTSHSAYYNDTTGILNIPLFLPTLSGAKYIRINCSANPIDDEFVEVRFLTNKRELQNRSDDLDLNYLIKPGTYVLYANHVYDNTPPMYNPGSHAWIIVETNALNSIGLQIFIENNTFKLAIRRFSKTNDVYTFYDWYLLGEQSLVGKKISFVGDSISTYEGYIPSGYPTYYPKTGKDVNDVNKTWWKTVVNKGGMTLVSNASWSGSGVADPDDDPTNNSAFVAYSDTRISDLSSDDNDPDIIVVLMGTNDFHRSIPIGTLTEASEVPDGVASIQTFKEAYACMINKIRIAYPHAHVYCCTLIQRYDSNDPTSGYPILNSGGLALSQYNKAICDISEWMGCTIIRLDTAISVTELADLTVDGSLHPNAAGHAIIANKVLQVLSVNETTY